ncbi:MAG TPA: esterase [Burkholderiales bacterium]|nr:esterase [Burkholderiales bacterium]
MNDRIEFAPADVPADQLLLLLHGAGALPSSLLPLANALYNAYPRAALIALPGFDVFDSGSSGRQWFSIRNIDEANRPQRIAAIMARVIEMVRGEQERWKVAPLATAIAGFSQGGIIALEAIAREDGLAGRVLAFSARYTVLPDTAPRWTTVHLFHGSEDRIIPARYTQDAMHHLAALHGDVTIDIAHGVGHELHPALIERAIDRLQSRIPIRYWQRAFGGVGPL